MGFGACTLLGPEGPGRGTRAIEIPRDEPQDLS